MAVSILGQAGYIPSMDEVSKRACISRSTVYRRFPNRESLLRAVVDRVCRNAWHDITASTVGRGPAATIIHAFAYTVDGSSECGFSDLLSSCSGGLAVVNRADSDPMGRILLIEVFADYALEALLASGATRPHAEVREVAEIAVRLALSYREVPINQSEQGADQWRLLAVRHLAPMIW